MPEIQKIIDALPQERKEVIVKLRALANEKLPKGFEERIQYGMISWVVPHSLYPTGYHVTPELPLPFLSIASQKAHVGFYHGGVYADEKLHQWFTAEYPKHAERKLDMGKSCIRFKKMEDIPYELLGKLLTKLTPEKWVELYESRVKK